MQVTKYGHSCVRFDDGDRSLTIDPGSFSAVDAALDGVHAILVTHEHPDHIDAAKIRAAAQADSALPVYAPQGALDAIGGLGDQGIAVRGSESFEAAGFDLRTFGDQHAVIHPQVPVIANVGFLVNGSVYHPGDSLVVAPFEMSTLLLPAMAPWAKLSEIVDYAVASRARHVHPIHDFLVKDVYFGLLRNVMGPIIEPFGIEYSSFDEPISV